MFIQHAKNGNKLLVKTYKIEKCKEQYFVTMYKRFFGVNPGKFPIFTN